MNRKEERNYSQSHLPVSVFYNTLDSGENRLLLHWHEYIEFIRVIEGSGAIKVDLEEYRVNPGDIILISPGSIHSGAGDDAVQLKCQVIIADLTLLFGNVLDETKQHYVGPLVEQSLKLRPFLHRTQQINVRISKLFDEIMSETEQKEWGYELYIKGALTVMLGVLFRERYYTKYREYAGRKEIAQVKQAMQYVEKHCRKQLSVEELAAVIGYSRYHFMHFFKQHTGYTATQYIHLVRTGQAARLLEDTEYSVSEISEQVGFQEVSYFIKTFSKRFGVSPLKYRKNRKKSYF